MMSGDVTAELQALRKSLKDLIVASNPALLASMVGLPMGDAYSQELQSALTNAKQTLSDSSVRAHKEAWHAGPRAQEAAIAGNEAAVAMGTTASTPPRFAGQPGVLKRLQSFLPFAKAR
jgi:hypothetical protein